MNLSLLGSKEWLSKYKDILEKHNIPKKKTLLKDAELEEKVLCDCGFFKEESESFDSFFERMSLWAQNGVPKDAHGYFCFKKINAYNTGWLSNPDPNKHGEIMLSTSGRPNRLTYCLALLSAEQMIDYCVKFKLWANMQKEFVQEFAFGSNPYEKHEEKDGGIMLFDFFGKIIDKEIAGYKSMLYFKNKEWMEQDLLSALINPKKILSVCLKNPDFIKQSIPCRVQCNDPSEYLENGDERVLKDDLINGVKNMSEVLNIDLKLMIVTRDSFLCQEGERMYSSQYVTAYLDFA